MTRSGADDLGKGKCWPLAVLPLSNNEEDMLLLRPKIRSQGLLLWMQLHRMTGVQQHGNCSLWQNFLKQKLERVLGGYVVVYWYVYSKIAGFVSVCHAAFRTSSSFSKNCVHILWQRRISKSYPPGPKLNVLFHEKKFHLLCRRIIKSICHKILSTGWIHITKSSMRVCQPKKIVNYTVFLSMCFTEKLFRMKQIPFLNLHCFSLHIFVN